MIRGLGVGLYQYAQQSGFSYKITVQVVLYSHLVVYLYPAIVKHEVCVNLIANVPSLLKNPVWRDLDIDAS